MIVGKALRKSLPEAARSHAPFCRSETCQRVKTCAKRSESDRYLNSPDLYAYRPKSRSFVMPSCVEATSVQSHLQECAAFNCRSDERGEHSKRKAFAPGHAATT